MAKNKFVELLENVMRTQDGRAFVFELLDTMEEILEA